MKRYEDILDQPYPARPHCHTMPRPARAAQFAPFDALEGYGDLVRETARVTESEPALDEAAREELDYRLQALLRCIGDRPAVRLSYFRKDPAKAGGSCVTVRERLLAADLTHRTLRFVSGLTISVRAIVQLEQLQTGPEQP